MAEGVKNASKRARRGRKRDAEEEPEATADEATEEQPDEEQESGQGLGGQVTGAVQTAGAGATQAGQEVGGVARKGTDLVGDRAGIMSELRNTVREAALEVLRPAAQQATASAAKYAVKKGPELVKDTVVPRVAEAGGPKAVGQAAASKLGGAGGALAEKVKDTVGRTRKPQGVGRGRRLPVQEHVDVAVPIEAAYNQYTQFEDFPRFMHRVEKVEQRDDAHLMWHENIWGVRRQWEAEIVEQVPNERLVWRSTGGPQMTGVATFHDLADRLTRIYVTLDFQPQGLFEKTASGARISRRALKSDLMRFKAFVEMRGEETGAWRGRIEEGEVVEEAEEPEEEYREEEEEAPEAEVEEEPKAEEEPEAEAEEEEEEEEPEDKPARRRPAARRATTRRRR